MSCGLGCCWRPVCCRERFTTFFTGEAEAFATGGLQQCQQANSIGWHQPSRSIRSTDEEKLALDCVSGQIFIMVRLSLLADSHWSCTGAAAGQWDLSPARKIYVLLLLLTKQTTLENAVWKVQQDNGHLFPVAMALAERNLHVRHMKGKWWVMIIATFNRE